ncbi:MAG: PIN domain-containing protein [Pirellulales bacterium]
MRKNVVLIDFESVQPAAIEAIDHEHFSVLVFCGANQSKISFEIAATLQKLGPRAQYIKISGTGPNALDFHIAFYIGRIVQEDPTAFFHIISKDKGFDPLIEHLRAQKILAARSESISDIPFVKNGALKTPLERAEAVISRLKSLKANKPRSLKTLGSFIKSHFQSSLEESEVAEVVKAIAATGYFSIEDGKVVYADP